ncbi:MAG: hypothetical protein EOP11_20415, partial [Proteobacteria bacterium]
DGASYIAGTTDGALAGQALSGASDALLAKYDSNGSLQWVRLLGGTNAAEAKGACTDPFGGIYIAGKTDGIFDGHALLGSVQGFLAKYDAAGTLQWSRTMGGTISAEFRGCATDAVGHVYALGVARGTIRGYATVGFEDLLLAKYDRFGNEILAAHFGEVSRTMNPLAISFDGTNLQVAGSVNGSVAGQVFLGNLSDGLWQRYSPMGAVLATKLIGVAGGDTELYGAQSGTDANTYLAGTTTGNLDGELHSGNGVYDVFFTSYDSFGTRRFTKLIGGPSSVVALKGLALDSSDNACLAGLANGPINGVSPGGTASAFMISFSSAGSIRYTKFAQGDPAGASAFFGVAADAAGNCYGAGYVQGAELAGVPLAGLIDAVLVKYDANGDNK